jgi:hypothetical protein
MVRAAPNRSLASVKVHNVRKEGSTFLADLEVLSAESVAGFPDFVNRYVGSTIQARVMPRGKVTDGSVMKVMVRYEGDEHGGIFYAEEV